MKKLAKVADRMLGMVAPKASAAACSGCTLSAPMSGPCQGGYAYIQCCYYNESSGCVRVCGLVCP